MPTYSWGCREGHEWDVVSTVAERKNPQACPTCGGEGLLCEVYSLNIDKTAAGSWNQASYNPGLGCWTESTKHARQIAKARGLEEIGNEPVENVHKHYDQQRKDTWKRRWAEADREKLYD